MARRPRPGAHEVLLDAAREEFSRVGVERARVEDIARRAGISKGAFYLHFPTKDAALREIVQRLQGALEDHVRRRHEVEERTAGELARDPGRIEELFEAECAVDVDLLELLWRHRHILAVLDGAGNPHRTVLAELRQRMRERVATRIVERQRGGVLRPDVDPVVFAGVIVGGYEDVARQMADLRAKPDLAAWARAILVVLYEGILPRGAAPIRRAPSN